MQLYLIIIILGYPATLCTCNSNTSNRLIYQGYCWLFVSCIPGERVPKQPVCQCSCMPFVFLRLSPRFSTSVIKCKLYQDITLLTSGYATSCNDMTRRFHPLTDWITQKCMRKLWKIGKNKAKSPLVSISSEDLISRVRPTQKSRFHPGNLRSVWK